MDSSADADAAFSGVLPDDLPDGLVVTDGSGVIQSVNAAAVRCIGVTADQLLGRDIRTALPLQDTNGRRWWDFADPWSGLSIRTGHRERLLLLPGGRELLVTARYVRETRLG